MVKLIMPLMSEEARGSLGNVIYKSTKYGAVAHLKTRNKWKRTKVSPSQANTKMLWKFALRCVALTGKQFRDTTQDHIYDVGYKLNGKPAQWNHFFTSRLISHPSNGKGYDLNRGRTEFNALTTAEQSAWETKAGLHNIAVIEQVEGATLLPVSGGLVCYVFALYCNGNGFKNEVLTRPDGANSVAWVNYLIN